MDEPKMPWSGIVKATAGFATVLTWICWGGVQMERREIAESKRVRWTDAARWERD